MTVAHHSGGSSTRRFCRWLGAVGALVGATTLAGCPGTLDQALSAEASGAGGGGNPTGGTGGTTGTGGSGASNCTGGNSGAALITASCASTNCHIPGAANDGMSGGLDLTIDANIGARLVGVLPTGNDGSACGGTTKPYLDAIPDPATGLATGLLIDKITISSGPALCPGGLSMPYGMNLLPAAKQACIIQWATTLVSP